MGRLSTYGWIGAQLQRKSAVAARAKVSIDQSGFMQGRDSRRRSLAASTAKHDVGLMPMDGAEVDACVDAHTLG